MAAQEQWTKERLYGERDTVLWAILDRNSLRVIGSFLKEDDADQAIADHHSAPLLLEAAQEVYDSIPASSEDPLVPRHAKALLRLAVVIAQAKDEAGS